MGVVSRRESFTFMIFHMIVHSSVLGTFGLCILVEGTVHLRVLSEGVHLKDKLGFRSLAPYWEGLLPLSGRGAYLYHINIKSLETCTVCLLAASSTSVRGYVQGCTYVQLPARDHVKCVLTR